MKFRRVFVLGAALAASGAVAYAAPDRGAPGASAGQAGVARQVHGPHSRPMTVTGVLSAPAPGKAPVEVATAFLATRPAVLAGADPATLTVAKVSAMRVGHAVRYEQTAHGLPVIGGETVVRVDGQNRVRYVSSTARVVATDFDVTPTMPAAEALATASRAGGYSARAADIAAGLDPARHSKLVIFAHPGDQPRLAYWVELPVDWARMVKVRAFVDAHTGIVLRVDNLVHTGEAPLPDCPDGDRLAYVYEPNPVDGELACVSLGAMLDGEQSLLENGDVRLANCIDNNACQPIEIPMFGTVNVHFCDQQAVAASNVDGHFTDHVFVSDTEPEDTFSEIQMFYHVNKVYDVARSLGGFTDLNEQPLNAVVNMRIPALDLSSICTGDTYEGTAGLMPFDNAAFIAAGSLFGFPPEDSIVFGQGNNADFAYDGDVVYHEFGHAVMNTVAPMLPQGFIDEHGFNPEPGGMHEGYADLLTMFVTDDPEIGEYASTGLAPGQDAIRVIDNDVTCPEGLIGQVHNDSLPITGAMWEAREAVATTPADKTAFDAAVFAAQQTFTAFEDFESATAKTVTEIEMTLGAAAATTVEGIFAERGVDGCNDRVLDGSAAKDVLFVSGTDQFQGATEIPGPVQWRLELAEDSVEISVAIASVQGGLGGLGGGGGGGMVLVVKPDASIAWSTTGGNPSGDYTAEGDIAVDMTAMTAAGTVEGSFPAGTYYVQIVNRGASQQLGGITLSSTAGEIGPDAGPGGPDAGPGGGVDEDGGDCGCTVGARRQVAPGLLALFGFAILGMIWLVRRRA